MQQRFMAYLLDRRPLSLRGTMQSNKENSFPWFNGSFQYNLSNWIHKLKWFKYCGIIRLRTFQNNIFVF